MGTVYRFSKGAGICIGIIMFLLGCWIASNPAMATIAGINIMALLLLVYGIVLAVEFFTTTPKSGWLLISGILFAVLASMMLGANEWVKMEVFGFVLAFQTLMSGMDLFTMNGALKRETGAGSVWLVAGGIISIIIGIFFLSSPLMFSALNAWFAGVYLIAAGIVLFLTALFRKPMNEA